MINTLGVVIDSSLNWKVYIGTVSAKVSKAIGFLRHAKAFYHRKYAKIYTLVL